jgi:glycosyltransferase involved in cell wall biosynthesis
LPADQLAAPMAEASVLAIPSLFEVAPVILAEAWAMRLPVVASAVGGIPGLASGAAVLVPPGSASKLAERLIGVLRGYAGLDALVAEGRRRTEGHSSRAVRAKHLSLYSELLREHG